MTVKELIEKLMQIPNQNKEVFKETPCETGRCVKVVGEIREEEGVVII